MLAIETVVGAVFGGLLKAVLETTEKAVMFKQTLADLKSTLLAIAPVIKDIEQYNIELGRPKELQSLISQMEEGTQLVRNCSEISKINFVAQAYNQRKLESLGDSLTKFFTIDILAHIVRDQKKIFLMLQEMYGIVKKSDPTSQVGASFNSAIDTSQTNFSADYDQHQVGQIFEFSLNGKKCCMLTPRSLSIAWGDNPRYWKQRSFPALARFLEVAELVGVCWLEIKGRIKTGMLSPKTWYGAYLVFKQSSDGCYGFNNQPVEVSVGVAGESDDERRTVYLVATTKERLGDEHPKERGDGWSDGWMEVKLGDFFNGEGVHKEIEIKVKEIKDCFWKGGIIILGIEIRPV